MKVLAIPEVIDYLEELTTLLYEKEYFGFVEFAHNYVDELINDIKTNLPTKLKKPAPKRFQKYGTDLKYASFKKNRQTTWYVFFEVYRENEEAIYVIKHIENNHTAAQYLEPGFLPGRLK